MNENQTRGRPTVTNFANLPQAIVNAVQNDPYDKGNCDYTVTQLIGPPQINILMEKHPGEISEDASDRIWSLLGQAVHSIVERHGQTSENTIEEWRLYGTFDGAAVGGQADLIDLDAKTIADFKVTSVWKIVNHNFTEWEQQLNPLAALVRQNGGTVEHLKVFAILRDWSKHQVGNGYPKHQVVTIDIPVWPEDKAISYLSSRVGLHRYAKENGGHPCTDNERWKRPDKWAVKKKGNKKAKVA